MNTILNKKWKLLLLCVIATYGVLPSIIFSKEGVVNYRLKLNMPTALITAVVTAGVTWWGANFKNKKQTSSLVQKINSIEKELEEKNQDIVHVQANNARLESALEKALETNTDLIPEEITNDPQYHYLLARYNAQQNKITFLSDARRKTLTETQDRIISLSSSDVLNSTNEINEDPFAVLQENTQKREEFLAFSRKENNFHTNYMEEQKQHLARLQAPLDAYKRKKEAIEADVNALYDCLPEKAQAQFKADVALWNLYPNKVIAVCNQYAKQYGINQNEKTIVETASHEQSNEQTEVVVNQDKVEIKELQENGDTLFSMPAQN